MKKSIVEMILEFIRQVRRSRRWQRAVTCVAALVVFVTTYALILPAITMEGNHPRLASEKLSGWAGDPMSVNVSAESPAGSGEKVVVLTAESVSAGLSEEYEFDSEGVTVFEDKMGQEIRLHRTVRENAEDTVDYWFVLAAGQKTEFELNLQDEIVVDDVIASAGIVENVRTNKADEAEKASASDAVKAEEIEAAVVVVDATASNAVKKTAAKATASNTTKASASNADADEVEMDEETGEINDGAVINDLDVSDIDQETEITATLKLNVGMGDELAEAIRDAEKNADKRGNASLAFRWKMVVNTTQELEWAEDGVTVHMYYNAAAKIPEGAHLSVAEILEDDARYQAYLDSAKAAVNSEASKATASNAAGKYGVDHARFFDIKILDAEDNEIEPEAQVVVKIDYDETVTIEENASIQTVHFPKEGGTEVIDAVVDGGSTNLDGVAFNANSFSVYGVLSTSRITIEHLSHDGKKYEVTVTFGPEAKIPDGAKLSVKDINAGTEEYIYARNAVLADKKAKGEMVDPDSLGLAALDISILDDQGKEIEPEAAVQVDLKIKSLPGVDDLEKIAKSLEIQHHVETEKGVVVEKVFDGSEKGSFQMDTDEKVAKEGTAVDPNSVSDADFRIAENKTEKADINASFGTEAFSTFTISWNNAYGNGVKVHYVDQNGNELTVANSVFPSTIGNNSTSPAYLIYDIDGYEYDHTYLKYGGWGSSAGWRTQNIVPLLERYSNGWAYSTNGSSWDYLSTSSASNKDEIYVVYKKKANVTQGGSPTLKPIGPGDYPEDPSILKESDPNGDGTSDLSLSITGHTKDREVEKLADVIVVFDVSGSMNDNLSGNTKRLAAAKTAVNKLVDNLAEKKNSNGNPLIRMALIPFSTTVGSITDLASLTSENVTSFKNTVNSLSVAQGNNAGTNWDAALQEANEMEVDSGRATFVIFVTDGDPTFRNTRTNATDAQINNNDISESAYLSLDVYGRGSSDDASRNYDSAVVRGQEIVGANKNLFTIGISNDVEKVDSFNTDVGGEGAYIASDVSGLNKAFDDIEAAIIAKLGISDIQMTDGITEMTQTVEKSGLTTTDGRFTYWKKGKDETTFTAWDPSSEGALEAEYDAASGAVKWNMGTNFMPEDGATYKVTWKVWPSQDAYDILAKCKNDPSFYETLTDKQKAQIVRSGDSPNYAYSLKTNEPDAGTTYKSATKTGTDIQTEGEPKTLKFNEVNPLGLASSQISMKKIWDNQLDDKEVTGSHTFPVKADGEDFGDGVVLSSTQNPKWQNSYFISTGLMTTDPYVVYEKGHDYKIEEPSDLSWQWDFKTDVYHPMVINNQTVNLIKVDTAAESDYTIGGNYYKALSGEAVLTATNERRSNLNISKTVVDKDGKHIESDQAFTFTVTVNEGHSEDVWLSAQDSTGTTVKDSGIVTGTGVQYQESDGYFHAPSGTTLTLTLKDGWNYRFTNLSVESTYSIEENSPVPEGYTFEKAVATATNGATAGTVTGQKTEGRIDKSNSVYTTAYTNKANQTTLKFRKTDENGTNTLEGATVEITKTDSGTGVAIIGSPFITTKKDIELKLFDGVYHVKETKAPDGYNILDGNYYFKTVNGTVTITDASGESTEYDDFTMTTEDDVIVLKLKNHPGAALPHTGGHGTLPIRIAGLALMLMGAAYVSYDFETRRRRERRLRK